MSKPKQRKGLVALIKQRKRDKEFVLEGLVIDIAYEVERLMREFKVTEQELQPYFNHSKLRILLSGDKNKITLSLLAEFLVALSKLRKNDLMSFYTLSIETAAEIMAKMLKR